MINRQRNIKAAFFDVDKTILNHDSMFLLARFILLRYPWRSILLLPIVAALILYKLNYLNARSMKNIFFMIFLGIKPERLDRLMETFVENAVLRDVKKQAHEKIEFLEKQGYEIYLVSASPDIYLKYFSRKIGIKKLICTQIESRGYFSIYKIKGNNCKGTEKITRIRKLPEWRQINMEESVAFGDSISDYPLLSITGKAVVVDPGSWNRKLAEFLGFQIEDWKN